MFGRFFCCNTPKINSRKNITFQNSGKDIDIALKTMGSVVHFVSPVNESFH